MLCPSLHRPDVSGCVAALAKLLAKAHVVVNSRTNMRRLVCLRWGTSNRKGLWSRLRSNVLFSRTRNAQPVFDAFDPSEELGIVSLDAPSMT